MQKLTRELWAQQDRHEGDRLRLFTAVDQAIEAERVLYPGSFVDIAPSFVWTDVTYNDLDKRVPGFFADEDGVAEIIAAHDADPGATALRFLPGDYRELDVKAKSVDLLISLYAGFISEACGHAVRDGGWLLVNASHGDAAMASIDDRFELAAVVESHSGDYRVRTANLDAYLVPRKPVDLTPAYLHELGRGIRYTRSPFAYLFRRTG